MPKKDLNQLAYSIVRQATGLNANALKECVSAVPGAPESITKHGQYIYNILGTLIGQGAVEKDAHGVYRVKEVA